MVKKQKSKLSFPPLEGKDDSSKYFCHDKDFKKSFGRALVVPIFTYGEPGSIDWKFIGTGFFVAQGIMVTAKHVVKEFHHNSGRYPAVLQQSEGNKASFRRVHQTSIAVDSDIAIMRVLAEWPEQRNACAVLTSRKPPAGALAHTFVFANTHIVGNEKVNIHMYPEHFRGKIVEQFPSGRDRSLLSWPCYQLDFHLHPGASGGPVFDDRGEVFAVNCMSMEPDRNIAYATSIDMVLDAIVGETKINGKAFKEARIRDLVDEGVVLYQ
jgi:S1-C subfamily serine protease